MRLSAPRTSVLRCPVANPARSRVGRLAMRWSIVPCRRPARDLSPAAAAFWDVRRVHVPLRAAWACFVLRCGLVGARGQHSPRTPCAAMAFRGRRREGVRARAPGEFRITLPVSTWSLLCFLPLLRPFTFEKTRNSQVGCSESPTSETDERSLISVTSVSPAARLWSSRVTGSAHSRSAALWLPPAGDHVLDAA